MPMFGSGVGLRPKALTTLALGLQFIVTPFWRAPDGVAFHQV